MGLFSRIVSSTQSLPSRAVAVLAAGFVVPQTAFGQEVAVIDSVELITYNVFAPDEEGSNFLFALANGVRFSTRNWVVSRELLLREGQPYDSALAAETARNLRRRGLFHTVEIDTVRTADGLLILRVLTQDSWSTQFQFNARSTGGEFTGNIALNEQNFLGTGNQASVGYRDEPDRTAWTFQTSLDRVGGTPLRVNGLYDDLSDGDVGFWNVGVPFRSQSDRSAAVYSGQAGTRRILQYRDGVQVDTLQRRRFQNNVTVAFAPRAGVDGFVRVGFQAQLRRDEVLFMADTGLVVPDTLTGAFGAFVEFQHPRFLELQYYNGFGRTEDIDLSTRVSFTTWVAPSAFGYERSGLGPVISARTGVVFGDNFASFRFRAGALINSQSVDSASVRAVLKLGSKAFDRQSTLLHVEAGILDGQPPGYEFDIGHGIGPRAFRSHSFTGDRTIWGILEHRVVLTDGLFNLLGIGLAGFFDYGGAWYADQDPRFGGDVGLGLRYGFNRSSAANVGRLDLAYRFGDGFTGNRWVVSFGRAFSF